MPISTKPPSGMRDFLPADIARRSHVVGVVRETYERYGFVPLETPAIENLEVLLGKYGEDEKLVYRLLHRGETLQRVLAGAQIDERALADQALRYDLTVPLARVVAQYGELPKFFKRYQIQPVWRADRPGKGRFREFYQCDVDITGSHSLIAEAEVCSAACDVLNALGFSDYRVRINHRELLRALIRCAGIEAEREGTALQAVDKLDKIGLDGVRAELIARGISDDCASRLLVVIGAESGDVADDLGQLNRLRGVVADDGGHEALDRLTELFDLLASTSAGPRASFMPTLARGLGYYTGAIFEITVDDLAGSIAGGGRYDSLVGMFGKRQVPAVGLSLGLERILVVMAERGMYPSLPMGPELMLCWMDVPAPEVLKAAAAIRGQGLRVEVFPDGGKLARQLQYADSPGVKAPWCGILGASELAGGELSLKHLVSGVQIKVAIEQVAATIAAFAAKSAP